LARKDATAWRAQKVTQPPQPPQKAAGGKMSAVAVGRVPRPGPGRTLTRSGDLLPDLTTMHGREIGMRKLHVFSPPPGMVVIPGPKGLTGWGRVLQTEIKPDRRRCHGLNSEHVVLLWESDYRHVLGLRGGEDWRETARRELDLELLMYAVCFGPSEPYAWVSDPRRDKGAARLHRVRDPFLSDRALALAHALADACIVLRKLPQSE
jgi:hypothetical protein